jgi:hypothetical protein
MKELAVKLGDKSNESIISGNISILRRVDK